MKLIVGIVTEDDSRNLLENLVKAGYRATLVSSTGSFLRQGNATFLIGVEENQVDGVLEVFERTCKKRVRELPPLPSFLTRSDVQQEKGTTVEIGGAVVFVLDVERFIKI